MPAPIVVADSITRVGPEAAGAVVVNASHGGIYANLPKGQDTVTLEEALALLAAKAARAGAAGKTARTRKAPAAARAKPAARKTRKA